MLSRLKNTGLLAIRLRNSIDLWGLLLGSDLFFNLILAWITSMDVKLRMIHFCGCLIKVVFLARTIIPVLIKLVHEIPAFDDKVVVCEPQGSCFEVTVFIPIRSCKSFMRVVIVCIVLVLGNRRLVF